MHVLPFGKWKNRPLADIDSGYLKWALSTIKLSSGLRAALADELVNRGEAPPAVPEPKAVVPACPRCGPGGKVSYEWAEDRLGRRQVRQSCRACGRSLGYAPRVSPYIELANASASPTAALDVLTMAEEQGVELRSDGAAADFAFGHWHKASPELRRRLRECRHLLGRLIGKDPGTQ